MPLAEGQSLYLPPSALDRSLSDMGLTHAGAWAPREDMTMKMQELGECLRLTKGLQVRKPSGDSRGKPPSPPPPPLHYSGRLCHDLVTCGGLTSEGRGSSQKHFEERGKFLPSPYSHGLRKQAAWGLIPSSAA